MRVGSHITWKQTGIGSIGSASCLGQQARRPCLCVLRSNLVSRSGWQHAKHRPHCEGRRSLHRLLRSAVLYCRTAAARTDAPASVAFLASTPPSAWEAPPGSSLAAEPGTTSNEGSQCPLSGMGSRRLDRPLLAPLPPFAGSHRTRETWVTPPWNVDDAIWWRAPPRAVGNASGCRARLAPGYRG